MAGLSISLSRWNAHRPKQNAYRSHAKITEYDYSSSKNQIPLKGKVYPSPSNVPKRVYYVPIVTARARVFVPEDRPEPVRRIEAIKTDVRFPRVLGAGKAKQRVDVPRLNLQTVLRDKTPSSVSSASGKPISNDFYRSSRMAIFERYKA